MSDSKFLEKRDAWLALHKQLETAREEIDRITAAHLRSEGAPPTRKMLDELDDLLHRACEARDEVDDLIHQHAS